MNGAQGLRLEVQSLALIVSSPLAVGSRSRFPLAFAIGAMLTLLRLPAHRLRLQQCTFCHHLQQSTFEFCKPIGFCQNIGASEMNR